MSKWMTEEELGFPLREAELIQLEPRGPYVLVTEPGKEPRLGTDQELLEARDRFVKACLAQKTW